MGRLLHMWVSGDKRYRLTAVETDAGRILVVALAPDHSIRISRESLDPLTAKQWIRMDDDARTAAAEATLSRGAVQV